MLLKILLIFAFIGIISSTLSKSKPSFSSEVEEEEIDLATFDNDDAEEEKEIDAKINAKIEAEKNKLFEDFLKKQLEKIEERSARMEHYLIQYYLKTDKNDDFGEVYFELNSQKRIVQSFVGILNNPENPALGEFRRMLTQHPELIEQILNIPQSLKDSVIKIENALGQLKKWENFESIFSMLDEQLHDIQLFKDAIENPENIPKQSHLLRHARREDKGNGTKNEFYKSISKMAQDDTHIFGFAVAEEQSYINLTIFGAQTKRPLGIIAANKDKFIKEFLPIFKHPKFSSLILQIETLENHVHYVKEIRQKLDTIENLPYIFVSMEPYMLSSIMMAAKVAVEVDESIVIVLVEDSYLVIREFKFTKKGYLESESRDSDDIKNMNHDIIEKRIIGPNNPAKIILHSNYPNLKTMRLLKQKILKKSLNKLIILEEDWKNYDTKFAFETAKYLADKRYTKYFILPVSFRNYMIGFECGGKKYPLIMCKKGQILPFKKTVTVPKTPLKYFFAHTANNDVDIIVAEVFENPTDTQAFQFTLEVDENNFLKRHAGGYLSGIVPALAKFLDKKEDFKIPVIAFYFGSSYIYLHDNDVESEGYKLLDTWNGKLGKGLFISFDEKKPKFFEKAAKMLQSSCSSVVHNIIETMSPKPPKQTFGYSLTSNSENPILFKYSNFDGIKKTATPASIMSKLLKEHFKAIQSATGESPNEIAFSILDETYDKEEKNQIKKELKKSCDLINIDCSFVDTDFATLF